jgi:hypothetical protein
MNIRWIAAAIIGASLAGCTANVQTGKVEAPAAPGCAQAALQAITLLGTAPDYVVETRSFDGPAPANADAAAVASSNPCANATVVLTVRRIEDGGFVHGFVSSMNRMDLIEGHAGPAFGGAEIGAFLGEWAKVTVATTDAAPAAPSLTVSSNLNAAAYAALRAKKAPMVCHATSVHDRDCFTINAEDPYRLTPFFTENNA